MSGNKALCIFSFFLILVGSAASAAGQGIQNLGAHRFGGMDEFQRVIDAKCTICHSDERVERAIENRKDLEKIERNMEAHGAILSAHDKKVLGAFWGDPLKGKSPSPLSFPAIPPGPQVSRPSSE